MKLRLFSSLEKIFSDQEPTGVEQTTGVAWQGEVFAFQVAGQSAVNDPVPVEIDHDFPGAVSWREVIECPSELTCYEGDDQYLRRHAGVYPDLLQPRPEGKVRWPRGQWRALWITVRVPAVCPAGDYAIMARIGDAATTFHLQVAACRPAPFTLHHIEWFHPDCLANFYGVAMWSAEYWRIVENFIRNAADHRINTLYTPLWTPPLDTAVGGERLTAQLLGIKRSAAGDYEFDFSRLERWCRIAREAGMTDLELSHFFTQWGAKATPKIVAEVAGREQAIFGWSVAATDPEYARFLQALLPQLHDKLEAWGWKGHVFFHISDEPSAAHLADYRLAREILRPLSGDWKQIDALSHYEFYEQKLVDNPIPSIGVIDEFFGKVPELWTYYCCGPDQETTNRFFAMASARTRMLGVLAYVYDIVGFLHWGFNFYYTQCAQKAINPFLVTDGGRAFPSGDAFLVYPGDGGEPWDSIRHEVLREGWQDWCVLKQHEIQHGREATLRLLHEGLDYRIDATHYPLAAAWLLTLRDRLRR